MLNNALRELATADKNKFIDNKTNIVNILRIFKCEVEDYLNYINEISRKQCNRISIVINRKEKAKMEQ